MKIHLKSNSLSYFLTENSKNHSKNIQLIYGRQSQRNFLALLLEILHFYEIFQKAGSMLVPISVLGWNPFFLG